MSITIEREPMELAEAPGQEQCIFCEEETLYWHIKSNRPVCPVCSVNYNVKDIPTAPHNY